MYCGKSAITRNRTSSAMDDKEKPPDKKISSSKRLKNFAFDGNNKRSMGQSLDTLKTEEISTDSSSNKAGKILDNLVCRGSLKSSIMNQRSKPTLIDFKENPPDSSSDESRSSESLTRYELMSEKSLGSDSSRGGGRDGIDESSDKSKLTNDDTNRADNDEGSSDESKGSNDSRCEPKVDFSIDPKTGMAKFLRTPPKRNRKPPMKYGEWVRQNWIYGIDEWKQAAYFTQISPFKPLKD